MIYVNRLCNYEKKRKTKIFKMVLQLYVFQMEVVREEVVISTSSEDDDEGSVSSMHVELDSDDDGEGVSQNKM